MSKLVTPRWGWALTGSECIELVRELEHVDIFVSKATCDTAPELLTRTPDGMVKVFPRRINLENAEKLKSFEARQVADSLSDLKEFIAQRRSDMKAA